MDKVVKKTKFFTVILTVVSLIASSCSGILYAVPQAQADLAGVSTGLNFANFPSYYSDGATNLQPCLGTDPAGTGATDPLCILTAAAMFEPGFQPPFGVFFPANFPSESFYWFAEAPLTINGQDARFRMVVEAAFVNGTVTDGKQITFARASLVSRTNAFAPNSTFHVEYPFGSFDFSTDGVGGMVASSPTAAFQPKAGGDAEMRAEDALGAAPIFAAGLATPNTGISTFLRSTDPTTPAGYLGFAGPDINPTLTPITNGTNGNAVIITETDGTPTTTISGGADWMIAGKLALSDITALTAAISAAQGVLTAATPGNLPGQFAPADIATLQAAISAAGLITTADPQATVDAAVIILNNAVTAFQLTVVVPPSNIAALTAAQGIAQGLITVNAPESATPGDHIIGSLATLQAALAAANATAADTQAVVDGQVATLNAAIATYNAAIVPAAPTLTDIVITTPATKTVYTVGDALDIADLVVTGTYSDASTQIETVTAANVSGFDSTVPVVGQILTVTVGGQTATYAVDINAAPVTLTGIAITTPATKTVYTVGDALDIAGMVVTGTYSDATTKTETVTVADVTGFDSTTPAVGQILTVTVGGQTATYSIEIKDNDNSDTTAPIITLIGANTIEVVQGAAYAELGATAADDVDGAFAATVSGTVDTSTVGTYAITYTATDAALNQAIPVTRAVNVVAAPTEINNVPIYRLYNTKTGVHLYTRGDTERDNMMSKWPEFEFTDGAPAFFSTTTSQAGLTPIYRLYNTKTGVHLYAKGDVDRDFVLNKWPEFEFTDGVPAFYQRVN